MNLNLFEEMSPEAFSEGAMTTISTTLIVLMVILAIGIYIYSALAWQRIAKKLKYKNSWLAWIPFANLAMIFQLGKIAWGWVFLTLIPIVGILLASILNNSSTILAIVLLIILVLTIIVLGILTIIATWRIFEKRKYPGWFSLSMIIPEVGAILYLVAIGFVAWKDRK